MKWKKRNDYDLSVSSAFLGPYEISIYELDKNWKCVVYINNGATEAKSYKAKTMFAAKRMGLSYIQKELRKIECRMANLWNT